MEITTSRVRSIFLLVACVCLLTMAGAQAAESANTSQKEPDTILGAAIGDNLDRVKQFVESGADVNAREPELGLAPLHNVRHKEVAEYLLSKGAKVDVVARDGSQPVHRAAGVGDVGLITLLLDAGADVNAAEGRNDWLIELSRKNNTLAYLDTKEPESNLNICTEGRTPLHVAAHNGCMDAINLLLKRGARVDAQTKVGVTPLEDACMMLRLDCVEALLKAGGDIKTASASGYTPLHYAVMESDDDVKSWQDHPDPKLSATRLAVIKTLAAHGADLNAQTKDGRTPLHLAVKSKCKEAQRLLVELGADPKKKDNNGNPARTTGILSFLTGW